ncbi:MAG: methyltransferase domain-containing protein [Flavobacteriales bacterium]
MEQALSEHFWNERYEKCETGWDIGYISTPLKDYFDQLTDKEMTILIPGCGNAYEAEYLNQLGFKNVVVLDFSKHALQQFKQRVPTFPEHHLIGEDFFKHQGAYDLMVEQTFFCALHPSLRAKYAEHTASLLKSKGKLVGLLFDDVLNTDHPPFGGNKAEYLSHFSPYFDVAIMETATNSIPPRAGRELFIKMIKK